MKTIGVIGLGSIGSRHAKNLLDMGHSVLGYDPDTSKMRALLDLNDKILEKKIAGWFTPDDHDDKPYLHAIIIASPTPLHLEHLQMTEGKPVFIEKPIAHVMPMHIEHVVAVGNNLRFHSCVKKAKEWLTEGLIGDPIWASFTCGQLNTKYTEDVILNWGAHELDLARYLLGEAVVTHARGYSQMCDIIMGHLGSGCHTTVHLDYQTNPELRGFTIAGTKGNLHALLSPQRVVYANLNNSQSKDPIFWPEDSYDQNYVEEMQAFLDTIDGKPSPLLATGEDGLATLEMILKAKELAGI